MARPFGTDQGAYYPPHQARLVACICARARTPTEHAGLAPLVPHYPRALVRPVVDAGRVGRRAGEDEAVFCGWGVRLLDAAPKDKGKGSRRSSGRSTGRSARRRRRLGRYYNPYDGIDTTYREGEGQTSGGEREAPAYTDPNNSGGQYYHAQKHAA